MAEHWTELLAQLKAGEENLYEQEDMNYEEVYHGDGGLELWGAH